MKKILVILMMVFGMALTSSAQNYMALKATSFAVADINPYTKYYTWSEWYECSVSIILDTTNDVVYINSNTPQKYAIFRNYGMFTDNKGGKFYKYDVIDQDGDKGTMRLRLQSDGSWQLYIDFSNVAWVYNVLIL